MEQPDDCSIRICSNHSLPDGEKKGSAKWVFLVPLVPGSFYMFVISSFILSAKIGFGLSMNVAYIIAAILTAVYAVGVYMLGRKYAAKHTEE